MSEKVVSFRRRTAQHVPLPQSFLNVQRDFGLQAVGFPIGFELRRRRRGTEVWLSFSGGFRLNLSVDRDVWPKSFSDAREWCHRIADAYGFTAREIPRKRKTA